MTIVKATFGSKSLFLRLTKEEAENFFFDLVRNRSVLRIDQLDKTKIVDFGKIDCITVEEVDVAIDGEKYPGLEDLKVI
ncbi:hypothetical protein E4U03_11710 [Rothia nasimurium]|uniref:Uncharacterized protein n=1 Tax=Rothia nasimurium TaxID=85336 RepID=A0A4Y9F0D9_9MICC|nr:hypothetical protein [Rothia nasimurium]MBF0809264.1 hypothetical protein [Rothia nasimurium]TFU20215.1 hypothetical protein E4U03_11710 [Rothia nasimurium]